MTSPSLTDQERVVLAELRKKITDLRAAGRIEQALQFAARTPYRKVLLQRRRGR